MSGRANHSRLTSMTYPDGFVVNDNYSSGLNDAISRLSSLSDTSGTLEGHSYLGLGTVVIRSHPQPGVGTYIRLTGRFRLPGGTYRSAEVAGFWGRRLRT